MCSSNIVPCSRIYIVLAEKAGPGEGHESAQLVALLLVVGVVYVRRRLLQQKTCELQQRYAHAVRTCERILRVDHLTYTYT